MKQIFLSILFFSLIFIPKAQNQEAISIGSKITFASKTLNENRKLWIYTPDQSSVHPIPDKKYPVLYLLDGDAHFYSTVGLIQQLSQANLNSILPEMVVVGIENTNRSRDLTPIAGAKSPFITFLEKELIPYIDQTYNAAPYRVLVGHSLGGLLAIDILTNQSDIFNAYIAIDPSMWYNNEKFLNQAISQLPNQKLSNNKLFIGTANTMPKGINIENIDKDKSVESQHIRSILKLDKFLTKQTDIGLQYRQKFYESESHNSVPLISEYDGLRFIFDYYRSNLSEKDFQDSTSLIAIIIRNHYQKISKELGYIVAPPEDFISFIAYDALSNKHFEKAEALYQLNIENNPKSHKVLSDFADYFATRKDTIKAVEWFNKALQLKDDTITNQKLKSITQQNHFILTEQDLQAYVGEYILKTYQISILLEIKEGKLWSKVPGQPDSEMVPVSKNVFSVRDKQGYTVTFHREMDKVMGFTSVQPNGTFTAILKD